MDDLVKAIKLQLYERATSPLFSAFILSWFAWNYRLVVVILSGMQAPKKLDYIDSHLYPTTESIITTGGIYPLLTALTLLLLLPYPALWVFQYVRQHQKRLKHIQQKIDDDTPLTQEEARELRNTLRKAQSEFEASLVERQEVIERLRQEISELKSKASEDSLQFKNSKRASPNERPEPPLDSREIELLQKIAASTYVLENALIGHLSDDRVRLLAKYSLDRLVARKLIDESSAGDQGMYYEITPKGRAALVEEMNIAG